MRVEDLIPKKTKKIKNRIFLLGIDGADLEIINNLIKTGSLPNFKKLLENSSYNDLLSPIIANSAPSWSSIFTGKSISNHGILYFQNQFEDKVEFFDCYLNTIDGERLWTAFDQEGYISCIVNVPITYPPEPVNGIMISGRLASETSVFAYPETLTERLKEDGYHPTFDTAVSDDDLFEILDKRIETALELIQKIDWDLFFQGFLIIDWIMHHFSEDSILKQVKANKDISEFTIVKKAYQKMDSFLGKLMKILKRDDKLFIFSDHGFKRYDFMFNVNIWLIKNHFLTLKRPPLTFLRDMFLYFPTKIKRAIFGQKNILGIRQPTFDWNKNVDWEKTLFYSPEFFVNCSSFRMNPYLKLEDAEKNKLITQLIEKLKAAEYKGLKIFKEFKLKEDIFKGKYIFRMPELLGILNTKIRNDKRIYGKGDSITDKNSVEHRREGIFIAHGNDIKPGKLKTIPEVKDIFPTVRFAADLPIHNNLDGNILNEIFTETFNKLPKKINETEIKPVVKIGQKYDESLKERLKDLGYM